MPRTKETRNPLGSIFKRKAVKNGKKTDVWDVRKRTPKLDANGEPERNEKGKIIYKDRTQRCYSHAEAVAALGSLPLEIEEENNKKLEETKIDHTLHELTAYYRKEYVKPAIYSGDRKIAGFKSDLKTIERHLLEIESFFGNVKLKDLTYENIRVFREKLATTKTKQGNLPKPSTYHKKLTLLGRILNVAIQLDWLNISPMKRGKSLIQKSAEIPRNRMMTYEEEVRLLSGCKQHITITRHLRGKDVECRIKSNRHNLKVYVLASLDTGMRLGDIVNLKWWQLDFKKNVIYLTEEAAKESKTGVAGILPMIPRLKAEFESLKLRMPKTGKNDFVMPRMDVDEAFRKTCKTVGIEDLQFRDLRATGATRMLLAGNAAALVMKITRHTQTETFLNHYTAVDTTNAQIVGEKLQEFNEFQLAKAETELKRADSVTEVENQQKYAA